MTDGFLDITQAKVRQDNFELSQHAQEESAVEQAGVDDIKQAILMGQEPSPILMTREEPAA